MEKNVVLSVRLASAELRKLQLLAQVYDTSVNEIVRAAVDKHVEALTATESFKTRALALKQHTDDMLRELLKGREPAERTSSVLRAFPGSDLPIGGSTRHDAPVTDSQPPADTLELVAIHLDAVKESQFGAAAASRGRPSPTRQVPHSSFSLTWKQGTAQWTLDGRVRDGVSEVALRPEQKTDIPYALVWSNSSTGRPERFEIDAIPDGTFLVRIPIGKARKRVEAIQGARAERDQLAMLPSVRT